MAGKKMHKKLHKLYRRFRPVFVVLVLIIVATISASFAKYYSMQKQKGVAVASDFYFTSDILKKGLTLGENISNLPEGMSPYVATNVWNPNSTYSAVTFVVRNYANFLLYNDENIEITYNIYARMSEEDNSGIRYYLGYGEGSTVELSADKPVVITDTIKGGEPLANTYSVEYKYAQGITSIPKTVYVWVVPTAPSYLPKEEYSMGCAIGLKETTGEFSFTDGWGFIALADSDEPLSDVQTDIINAQAGLVYNISTTGSNTSGNDNGIIKVLLSWNYKYVELDKFSKFYDADKIITDSSTGMKKLEITINTYTSNNILFYRTNRFNLSEINTQKAFAAVVDAEMITETQTAEE